MYYPSSENKGADITAKLICAFVFAYADCWFSHGEAHFLFSKCKHVKYGQTGQMVKTHVSKRTYSGLFKQICESFQKELTFAILECSIDLLHTSIDSRFFFSSLSGFW